VGVIARREEYYPFLRTELTAERVKAISPASSKGRLSDLNCRTCGRSISSSMTHSVEGVPFREERRRGRP